MNASDLPVVTRKLLFRFRLRRTVRVILSHPQRRY
jgi:hypothetical protein